MGALVKAQVFTKFRVESEWRVEKRLALAEQFLEAWIFALGGRDCGRDFYNGHPLLAGSTRSAVRYSEV